MAVYKDKSRGTWYASFLYVDWTGKRCRKLKRGFATKKEAQEWEMHFKLQKASSLDMTFGDFYKIYEQDIKPKVRYNTWCSKQHIIETKLLPYFKDLVMRDITPRDIIQWQNSMREASKKNGGEYAGTYLKTVQAQLSCIFNHAVRFYQLPNNPVRIAGALGQYDSDEMLFWTKEEYMKFIPTMANKTYSYMAFELLYWCGVRLGELRALTPADIDFETNTLSITKSYQRIKGEDVITKPKTKKSKESVPVELDKHKNETGIEIRPVHKDDQSETMTGTGTESGQAVVQNMDSNNKELSNTELSNNHPITLSREVEPMDEAEAYIQLIRENIEYDAMMSCKTWRDRDTYEELYQLICDVVCVPRKTIRIGGEDYPYNLVKSKFLKLTSSHLEYVIS